jgi:hypothetical protein
MSVTEVVMKPGSWSLRLRAGTPKSIRDYLRLESVGFGHVVITPIRLADHTISWAGLLAVSRYTGVLRSRPSEFDIGGPGPVMWIGDEDGKSDSVGDGPTPLSLVGASFATWISNLRPAALTAGSVEAAAGSCTCTFRWANRRVALDQIVAFFGREYRVNPNLTLDAGLESYLYATATTPAAVVQPLSGGRESGVIGVHATSLDAAKDLDDYTTSVVVLGPNAVGSAAISPATSYKDGQGNAVRPRQRHDQRSSAGPVRTPQRPRRWRNIRRFAVESSCRPTPTTSAPTSHAATRSTSGILTVTCTTSRTRSSTAAG